MDLRPHLKRNLLLEEGMALIQQAKLWYQPFILADGVEVGEGQNLEDRYRNCESLFDNNVFLSRDYKHYWEGNTRKLAADGPYFHECNRKYRLCYERIADGIVSRLGGDISGMSVLEVGCNTGLNLFNLAARGAKSCTGVDWTDHLPAFTWLNKVIGTDVRFLHGSYDNLRHTIPDVDVPEADVVLNTVFINHQSDPIHVLCYLADRAKKALFLWILMEDQKDEMAVTYGRVSGLHDLGAGKPIPLNFYNDIRPSSALVRESLRLLGFGEIEFIPQPTERDASPPQALIPFQLVWARRTEERRSALWVQT